jgi:hypothetical protein
MKNEKDALVADFKTLIDCKCAEIIASKPEKKTVGYNDFKIVTLAVRSAFKNKLQVIPKQAEVACELAEAIMAPTTVERWNRIRAAVGIGGGTAGIGMVIAGIGMALGWGAGVVSAVIAFFVGTSMLGPIAWIAGGVAVAGIAGYFAFACDDGSRVEMAINALKKGTEGAIEAIWPEFGEKLSA